MVFRIFDLLEKHHRCKAGGKITIYQPIILYRKFTADQIFTGHQLIVEPAVLITDASGAIIEIIHPDDAGDEIEVLRGLLTPGFINAHCHLELSHLKGAIPEKTGLVDFVQQVMGKRSLTAGLKQDAMQKADTEMYDCGIVAVGDICNTTDSIPVKVKSRLLWHNFVEVSGFVEAIAQKRLEDSRLAYAQFKTSLVHQKTTFSPHAPYSVSKKLFQLLNDQTTDQLITIHNQECAAEDELYQHKTGRFLELYQNFGIDISSFKPTGQSSFQSWLPYFTKEQSIISVHNSFTNESDINFATKPISYCLCINANQYIEQINPPIDLLMKKNCQIVLGTDSYASNNQLNILEEIKTIQRETNYKIPLVQLLQWATINGANTLQMQETVGSFERGKMPGIVLIEGLNNLETTATSVAKRIL
jgi:cytosine/adenosine deaminase-related metal-dependent hydrolase